MESIQTEERKVTFMNLITIGYYNEMPHGNPTDPSIKDCIGKEDRSLVSKISAYLSSGIPLAVAPGIVNDVIDPDKGIAGTPTAYTDGTWVWPGDLAYYVTNYRLKLPDEFTGTMQNNNWTIPIKLEDIDFDSLTINGKPLFS